MEKSKPKNFLTFKPARLTEGKVWFVSYYVSNPYNNSNELVRKRIKCNSIESIPERRKYCKALIHEINTKLYNGWNPFLENEASKAFVKLHDVMDAYLVNKTREKLSPDTIRTYKSKVITFQNWLKETKRQDIYVLNFKSTDALSYLNYLFIDRGFKNITYNKSLKWCRSLFHWMNENQYCKTNPFIEFKVKRQEEKERKVIPPGDREKIRAYFEDKESNFFLICLLVFGSLIRPKEITFLKPSFFDLKRQIIKLPAYATKNNKARVCTIPNSNIHYFVDYFAKTDIAKNQYLFDYYCNPSFERTNAKYYSRHWKKLRQNLGFPEEYKLYSLRDSGIIQMIQDGVSLDEVMKAADHSSLEITTIYAKQANPEGSNQVKRKSTGF